LQQFTQLGTAGEAAATEQPSPDVTVKQASTQSSACQGPHQPIKQPQRSSEQGDGQPASCLDGEDSPNPSVASTTPALSPRSSPTNSDDEDSGTSTPSADDQIAGPAATRSCLDSKPADLSDSSAAEASQAEEQPSSSVPAGDLPSGHQLQPREGKPSIYDQEQEEPILKENPNRYTLSPIM
jgi:hypothetical protein